MGGMNDDDDQKRHEKDMNKFITSLFSLVVVEYCDLEFRQKLYKKKLHLFGLKSMVDKWYDNRNSILETVTSTLFSSRYL